MQIREGVVNNSHPLKYQSYLLLRNFPCKYMFNNITLLQNLSEIITSKWYFSFERVREDLEEKEYVNYLISN